MLLKCVIFAIVAVFFIFLGLSFWRKKFSQRFPGKCPSFFNVFGDAFEVLFTKDVHIGVMQSFEKRIESFQKENLICVWISYVPFILLFKAKGVKELVRDNKVNEKSWIYKWLEPAFGTGLVTSSASKCKSRKKLLTPCFHSNMLREYFKVFVEESKNLVAVLEEETSKEFTCIENFITLCICDIIVETMFGSRIDALSSGTSVYKNAVNRGEEITFSRLYKPWLWPSFIFWNTKDGKEMKMHLNLLKELTDKIIQEKKKMYLTGKGKTYSGKHKALLDLLLEKHFETQELSEEDIKEEVKTFILAGHETVATNIGWTLYLIGLYPDVQAKIHQEIDQIFGKDVNRPITEMDLNGMQYLDCVLKESTRLYPAVPAFARQVSENTNLCGYEIPKGMQCVVLLYFLHRDKEVFPEPEKFDPDRFLPENSANIPECGYIPFSAGARNCIGNKFAEIERKTIVASILRNFVLQSLDGRDKMYPVLKVALHPSQPIRIKIRSRFMQEL